MHKACANCVISKVDCEVLGPLEVGSSTAVQGQGFGRGSQRAFPALFHPFAHSDLDHGGGSCVLHPPKPRVLSLPGDGGCNLSIKAEQSPAKDVFIETSAMPLTPGSAAARFCWVIEEDRGGFP